MSNSSQDSSSSPSGKQSTEVFWLSEIQGSNHSFQRVSTSLINILDDQSSIKQFLPMIEHSERESSLCQEHSVSNSFQRIQQSVTKKTDGEGKIQDEGDRIFNVDNSSLQKYFDVAENKSRRRKMKNTTETYNDQQKESQQFDEQLSKSYRSRISRIGRGKIQKSRVDTKNIIKNFGRNTISFVQKRKYFFSIEFEKNGKKYIDFLPKMKKMRKKINTIQDLRDLWINEEYGKLMRKISQHYLRKQALPYIFNSNVKTAAFQTHIQCRRRLQEAVRNPHDFTNLR